MVVGGKEDHRDGRACGSWRQCEWAVGPDGIKFSSAGVVKWLRNDLVRVLVRPATGVCSAGLPRASETYNQALFAS